MENREKGQYPSIEIPSIEVEGHIKDFGDLRAANLSGYSYSGLSAEFIERVDGQIGSPDAYLTHQIVYDAARIRLFDPTYPELDLKAASKLTKDEKLAKYKEQSSKYEEIFSNPDNLSRRVVVPFRGEMTGFSLVVKLSLHEMRHLDYLRATFAKRGFAFTKEMEYMGV